MKENEYKHPIENILSEALSNLKNIVDIGTVVGATIIPISKIMLGYVGGGGEYSETKPKQTRAPFATGSGAGLSVQPIGFLIEENGVVRYIQTNTTDSLSKLVNVTSDVLRLLKKEMDKSEN